MGNLPLNLQILRAMLPYFAASGHNLYAKSVSLYLVKMNALHNTHPKLYEYFMKEFHVDRYWAGLSTDLGIEQVLICSLKSAGGLTCGRSMTEIQRAVWVSDLIEKYHVVDGSMLVCSGLLGKVVRHLMESVVHTCMFHFCSQSIATVLLFLMAMRMGQQLTK